MFNKNFIYILIAYTIIGNLWCWLENERLLKLPTNLALLTFIVFLLYFKIKNYER